MHKSRFKARKQPASKYIDTFCSITKKLLKQKPWRFDRKCILYNGGGGISWQNSEKIFDSLFSNFIGGRKKMNNNYFDNIFNN